MRTIRIFISLCLTISFFLTVPHSYAATAYDSYIYEYLTPQNINSAANPLIVKLKTEVDKVISAGHLAPYRTLYGEISVDYSWYHNYDSVYTLSLAYPYLSSYPSTQSSILTYLTNELNTYPLTSASYLDVNTGTKREVPTLSNAERYVMNNSFTNRPKLFALYALWLYAQNTNNWSYIDTNWTVIKNFYNSYSAEVASYYTSIAGAIGMVRMARHKNDSIETSVVNDVVTGMNNGKNFTSFATSAENAFQYDDWQWARQYMYLGFQFLDISPEIGSYMYDDVNLKTAVIGTGNDTYSVGAGEKEYKFWWMAKAPYFARYYGEGSLTPPEFKAMIFPVKAWVQKEPAYVLNTYIDVPDAQIGDFYYMQNVVRAIEKYGNECWKDILTTSTICKKVRGDFTGEGNVNIQDLSIFLTKMGQSDKTNLYSYRMRLSNTFAGDSVNAQDLSILLTLL